MEKKDIKTNNKPYMNGQFYLSLGIRNSKTEETKMLKLIQKLTLCILFVFGSFSYVFPTERTFTPGRDYKGKMYVIITVGGAVGYEECSAIKVIWGPWETEPVSAIRSARSSKPLAIVFEKTKRDQVPLTVSANCPASIELRIGKPDSRSYEIIEPRWVRR